MFTLARKVYDLYRIHQLTKVSTERALAEQGINEMLDSGRSR